MSSVERNFQANSHRLVKALLHRVAEGFPRPTTSAQTAVSRFGRALLVSASARREELGGSTTPFLTFATESLLPSRIGAAQVHLIADGEGATALVEFLDTIRAFVQQGIESAETVDEVAEAVVDALDHAHAYLLAHELVNEAYLTSEFAGAGERIWSFQPAHQMVFDRHLNWTKWSAACRASRQGPTFAFTSQNFASSFFHATYELWTNDIREPAGVAALWTTLDSDLWNALIANRASQHVPESRAPRNEVDAAKNIDALALAA
jgi:hypothetical protein